MLGDCFEANANEMVEIFTKNKNNRKALKEFKLCHGVVVAEKHSPLAGKLIRHCWIEVNGDVLVDCSNGRRVGGRLSEVEYRIKRETVIQYSPRQVATNLLKFEHYGPWEDLPNEEKYKIEEDDKDGNKKD